MAELAKLMGAKWAHLTEDEKKVYYDQAAQEKLEYEQALAKLSPAELVALNAPSNSASSLISFPMSRIRKIAKLDPEVGAIGKDATFLLTSAVELFAQFLCSEAVLQADRHNRKTVNRTDIARACANHSSLWFLRQDFPLTSTIESASTRRGRPSTSSRKGKSSTTADESTTDNRLNEEGASASCDTENAGGVTSKPKPSVFNQLLAHSSSTSGSKVVREIVLPPPELRGDRGTTNIISTLDIELEEGNDGEDGTRNDEETSASPATGVSAAVSKGKKPSAGKTAGSKANAKATANVGATPKQQPKGLIGYVKRLENAEEAREHWKKQWADKDAELRQAADNVRRTRLQANKDPGSASDEEGADDVESEEGALSIDALRARLGLQRGAAARQQGKTRGGKVSRGGKRSGAGVNDNYVPDFTELLRRQQVGNNQNVDTNADMQEDEEDRQSVLSYASFPDESRDPPGTSGAGSSFSTAKKHGGSSIADNISVDDVEDLDDFVDEEDETTAIHHGLTEVEDIDDPDAEVAVEPMARLEMETEELLSSQLDDRVEFSRAPDVDAGEILDDPDESGDEYFFAEKRVDVLPPELVSQPKPLARFREDDADE